MAHGTILSGRESSTGVSVAAGNVPADAAARREVLHGALLESRQLWRDLLGLAADLAFETDAEGRFVLVVPDVVLGWPAHILLDQSAERLLCDGTAGCNPFRPTAEFRRRRAWLRRADGSAACFLFAAAPLLDAEGRIVGARGAGHDVTDEEGTDAALATALRRFQSLDQLLLKVRAEVLAPRMMEAALEGLAQALGAEGAAVVDLVGAGGPPALLHRFGPDRPELLRSALAVLDGGREEMDCLHDAEGRPALVCPGSVRFGEHTGLIVWRAPGGRTWDGDDRALAASSIAILRMILEHEAMQREMARQAHTDPLTGLLNRRAFLEEMPRRIERLEHDALPGTLMFLDLDNFKALNDARGHDVGDEALCVVAALMRSAFRPGDLSARFGGDEFAVWLDGMEELAAAERAEQLRVSGLHDLAPLSEEIGVTLSVSIGIATRWPGDDEEMDGLLRRADQAMYDVKRTARGSWRVAPRP